MRIIAGAWRGRTLAVPRGRGTRPTADRARQALFDMIAHASWAAEDPLAGSLVLDAFAGTGAIGLEALSRGAALAVFMERDRAALGTLRGNIECCGAGERARIVVCDARQPPIADQGPARWLFLDPPYGEGLVTATVGALIAQGWAGPGTILVAETSRDEEPPLPGSEMADRQQGAARIRVHRL